MNYEHAKIASFENGFETRLRQVMIKSALNPQQMWKALSSAGRAGKSISQAGGTAEQAMAKISPKFQLPQQMTTNPRILAGLGDETTSLVSGQRMADLARSNLRPAQAMAGARFAPGGALSQAARAGQIVMPKAPGMTPNIPKNVYQSPITGKAMGGGKATPTPVNEGFAKVTPETPVPGAGAPAPGTAGGGATPGSMSNVELEALGLVTPRSGGDPTGGLLGKIKGYLPQNVQDWAGKNPNLVSAGAGALGGGGLVAAGDAYGDAQRRKALANAGFMDRLGLAFQLATNPEGFANTLRL